MLPLMIFHQIPLVVCSLIASQLSRDPLPEAVGGEPGAGPLA
jgi:predicted Na+-dependent transporter